MARVCCIADALHHEERRRLELETSAPSSSSSTRPHAFRRRLLEADDSARHVPAGTEELVVAPRQQRPPTPVLYQQVDVDQRDDTADEEEHVFGQALPGIINGRLEGCDFTCASCLCIP